MIVQQLFWCVCMKSVLLNLKFEHDDLVNLDYTLSEIIHNALTSFKEYQDKIPSSFFKTPSPSEEEIEEALYEWNSVLDKMIFAFSNTDAIDLFDEMMESPYDLSNCVTDNVFTTTLKNGFTKDYEEEYNLKRTEFMNNYENKCKEGRMLFAQYFNSLWF